MATARGVVDLTDEQDEPRRVGGIGDEQLELAHAGQGRVQVARGGHRHSTLLERGGDGLGRVAVEGNYEDAIGHPRASLAIGETSDGGRSNSRSIIAADLS